MRRGPAAKIPGLLPRFASLGTSEASLREPHPRPSLVGFLHCRLVNLERHLPRLSFDLQSTMKNFLGVAAALTLAINNASAHYIAVQFALGSQKFTKYQHIRFNSNYNSPVTCMYMTATARRPFANKSAALASNDLRCNAGGGAQGPNTTTVDAQAGSAFTFTYDQAVYHQGPVSL